MRYFNPNAFYLMQYANDERKRFLLMYGGSSSAKSYSAAQVLLYLAYTQRDNALVMRKIGASISKTIYEDFRLAASQLHLLKAFTFTVNSIRCENGAKIDFCGIDDPEKIKGISNYKRVLLEELSEFEEPDFKQVRIRLRGMSGQQIWGTWNPISETHWIKQKFIDQEEWHDIPMSVEIEGFVIPSDYCRVKSVKGNAPKTMTNPRTGEMEEQPSNIVLIQSTYLNNFWVVGSPDGTYGFVDKQAIMEFDYNREHDENYYRIYALGEWGILKTGSEFFGSFNSGKHVKSVDYNPALPIHLSVDNNVLPYITCTMWQIEIGERKVVRQFGELMAENPNNTVRRAAKLMAGMLRSLNYADKVFLHADASTRAANTIDEEKRSFFDLYISTLSEEGFEVVDMAAASNPSVAMSGEFINKIFDGAIDGVEIEIGEGCKVSVNDYLSVQKDVNGGILKTKVKNKMTGQTYEDKAHASDTFRYLVCDVLKSEFIEFSNKRKRNIYAQSGMLNYFNPNAEMRYERRAVYMLPNIDERFVLVEAAKVGEFWNVVDVRFCDVVAGEEMSKELARDAEVFFVECADAYFGWVRDERARTSKDIRVVRMSESGIDGRILSKADDVRRMMRFDFEKGGEYAAFIENMMDYNRNSRDYRQASAAVSGMVEFLKRI